MFKGNAAGSHGGIGVSYGGKCVCIERKHTHKSDVCAYVSVFYATFLWPFYLSTILVALSSFLLRSSLGVATLLLFVLLFLVVVVCFVLFLLFLWLLSVFLLSFWLLLSFCYLYDSDDLLLRLNNALLLIIRLIYGRVMDRISIIS